MLYRPIRLCIVAAGLAAGALCAFVAPAWAQASSAKSKPAVGTAKKPDAKPDPSKAKPGAAAAPAPGGGPATLLGSFGDWGAYTAQSGKAKICYALSQPKARLPSNLANTPAYLFVSFRPAENVRNEVAVVMGFPTKDGPAEATVGATTYALVTKGANAWVKNPAEEGQVTATMAKGQALVVKATSAKNNTTSDRYSLSGFGQALERAKKECP